MRILLRIHRPRPARSVCHCVSPRRAAARVGAALTAQVGTTSGRREALEEEREVDFARYARLVLSRWWVVLAAVTAGAGVGFLGAPTGGSTLPSAATAWPGAPPSLGRRRRPP